MRAFGFWPAVLVAQWIAHQTSNLGVAGSNPVEYVTLLAFFVRCAWAAAVAGPGTGCGYRLYSSVGRASAS